MAWAETSNLKKTLTVSVAAGGSGYAVGDILTLVQTGASGATFKVLTLSTTAVATVEMVTAGTGYWVANTLATTVAPAGGTDCTLSITGVNYIGNHGRTGAGKYNLCPSYVKGNEDTVTFSVSFIKNSISTTTQFVSSPTDTATVAQQVFTITGTKNAIIPITVPKCVDGIVISLGSSGSAPTGTIAIKGYPDLQWA
jgi:hypothetical protein